MIPGSNLLNTAFKLIARQSFQYYTYSTRINQVNGQYESVYNSPVCTTGSAQPMPRELYEAYGLDFNSHYFRFYVARDVVDVGRDVAGDQIVFQGIYYQVLSITPWRGIDGWNEILAIQVPSP